MEGFVLNNEPTIRLGAFLGIFILMALWELVAPRRGLTAPKPKRWLINLGITALNTVAVRLAFSIGAVGIARWASNRGLGLFNNIEFPSAVAVGVACIVILDMLIYAQHVAFHKIRPLWRLHLMHHTDLDLDVTSGARFHPVEILLSMLIKSIAVIALGAPAWSVVVFEMLLNATAMFNHSNVRMPEWLDHALRLIVVTPDMHRVHHSVLLNETDSNYGFNLPWWDRIFGTYIAQPRMGHDGMKIGMANFRDMGRLGLMSIIALPFVARGEEIYKPATKKESLTSRPS